MIVMPTFIESSNGVLPWVLCIVGHGQPWAALAMSGLFGAAQRPFSDSRSSLIEGAITAPLGRRNKTNTFGVNGFNRIFDGLMH